MKADSEAAQCDPVTMLLDEELAVLDVKCGTMAFEVKPFAASPMHSHGSEETWIVRGGAGRALIGSATVQIAQGDKVVVPPNTPHAIENPGAEPLSVLAFWWKREDAGVDA
jgi:mannose-6-phosphate isomerase-like protein (cupin superfamily)